MKTRWLYWILLIAVGPVQAQPGSGHFTSANVSALVALQQQIRVARHDTSRIILLEKLSFVYLSQAKPDSAFHLLQQAFHLASQSKRPLDLGRVYRGFGAYYHSQKKYNQRIDAYQKAAIFFQQAHRVPEAARAMFDVAKGYASHFEQTKAVEQCNKNLAYAQQTDYYELVSLSYSLLYTIHLNFGNKKKAFADLMAMQKAAERYPTVHNRYLATANLAEWYDNHHDYIKALPYWQMTLSIFQKTGSPIEIVEVYTSIAADFIKLNQFDKAEETLTKGFQEIKKHHPISANIYLTVARLRERQNRFSEARQAVLVALTNARKTFQPFLIKSSLEALARIQEKQGKFRQALVTSHQLTALNDSINEAKHIQSITQIESQYNFQKKEKDITLLRQKATIQHLELVDTQHQKLIYSSLTLGLLLVVLLLGWIVWQSFQYVKKLNGQKAEISAQALRLRELNTIKDKLFTLISHDLRTPVIHLKANLDRLNKKPRSTVFFTQQTDQLKRTVNSLYYTLDNLLHWSATQQEGMLIKPQYVTLADLVAEVVELFESMILQKNISVAIESGNAFAWTDDGQALIVIRNIFHNALKFTPSGGHIVIGFGQSATEAMVHIADTGIGMNQTDPRIASQTLSRIGTMGETGTGFGLLVCSEFMSQNGGRLEIESSLGKGTIVKLIFKPGRPDGEYKESERAILLETRQ